MQYDPQRPGKLVPWLILAIGLGVGGIATASVNAGVEDVNHARAMSEIEAQRKAALDEAELVRGELAKVHRWQKYQADLNVIIGQQLLTGKDSGKLARQLKEFMSHGN